MTERRKGAVALLVLAAFVSLVLVLVAAPARSGVVTAKTHEPPHTSTLACGDDPCTHTYPAAWSLTLQADGHEEYVLVSESTWRSTRVGDRFPLTSH